jgi:hypothetical protein
MLQRAPGGVFLFFQGKSGPTSATPHGFTTEPGPGFDSTRLSVIQSGSHFSFYICQPELAGIECDTC